MTTLPLRTPMLSVQPTLQELQVVETHSSDLAIHLFGFSSSVAVGQTSMQAPQKSQLDSCTGPPAPTSMRAVGPRPARVIAPVCRISSQARTQRVQMMHIWGSNSRKGFARSASGGSDS